MSDLVTGFIMGRSRATARASREAEEDQKRIEELSHTALSLREQNRQSRAAAAGKDAVRRKLVEALTEVAPNHPLANPVERNPLRDKIYSEAFQREYDRNTPGAYDQ